MIELKPGDVFGSFNPQGVGKLISWRQSIGALDGKSEYGHTGFINDAQGTTTECLWSIKHQNLFEAYKGTKVFIARWQGMTPEAYEKGFAAVKPLIGKTYPFHRLLLHMIGVAKWVHILPVPVCSETTDKMLDAAGAPTPTGPNSYWGVNPNELTDFWRIHKEYDTVFEGVI